MHGIMAIDQLGMDKLRAAAKIILHSDHGVPAGLHRGSGFTAVIPVMGVRHVGKELFSRISLTLTMFVRRSMRRPMIRRYETL